MEMNMKSLNVFSRINELELQNLHLNVMLKSARADIQSMHKEIADLYKLNTKWLELLEKTTKPKAKPGPKPGLKAVKSKETLDSTRARKAAYARKYYAKKRAEKAAA